MWWIILIVVAVIIIRFASASNKQAKAVIKQGGMRTKYRVLVNHFLEADPKTKIFNEGATFITIGLSSMAGTTIFDIQQTYGSVTIRWKVNSPVFGKHNLEWSFDEFGDQNIMIRKIENDLVQYQDNMMQKYV